METRREGPTVTTPRYLPTSVSPQVILEGNSTSLARMEKLLGTLLCSIGKVGPSFTLGGHCMEPFL